MQPYQPTQSRVKPKIAVVLVLGCLVMVLANCIGVVGVFQGLSYGLGTSWQRLPDPPQGTVELAGVNAITIFVKDGTGEIFSCTMLTSQCWVPDVVHADSDERGVAQIELSCSQDGPAYWAITLPPSGMKTCIEIQDAAYEKIGGVQGVYALTESGALWAWRHEYTFGAMSFNIFYGLVAGVFGLVVQTLLMMLFTQIWYIWNSRPAAVKPSTLA